MTWLPSTTHIFHSTTKAYRSFRELARRSSRLCWTILLTARTREIHREFPHLSLGAIHSALAYYYDHQTEVDEDIARRKQKVDEIKAEIDRRQGPSLIRLKLKAKGLLP